MTTAKTTATAMQDLRAGRITPDQYRAIMREQKAAAGSDWERVKFAAIRHDLKTA